jgi:hypothetical protein
LFVGSVPDMARQPTGSISHRWYAIGYQAAFTDALDAYERGGTRALLQWSVDNCAPEDRDRAMAALRALAAD